MAAAPTPSKLRIFAWGLILAALLVNGIFFKFNENFYRLTFFTATPLQAQGLVTAKLPLGGARKSNAVTVVFPDAQNQPQTFIRKMGVNEPIEPGDQVAVIYDNTGVKLIAMMAYEKSGGWAIAGLGAFIFFMFALAAVKTFQQAWSLERK